MASVKQLAWTRGQRARTAWFYFLAAAVSITYIALGIIIALLVFDYLSARLANTAMSKPSYAIVLLFFLLMGGVSAAYYASKIFSRLLLPRGESYNPRLSVRVSVIIPAYNAENTIGRVLRALIEQDYPKDLLEIVVIDDGSTDMTYSIARFYANQYPYIHVVRHKANLGKARALTSGILRAHGDVIVLLDSDTIPEKQAIKRLVSHLVLSDELGAVGGNIIPAGVEGLLYWLQRIEYLLGFSIGRFFAHKLLGANPVLSGAFVAFRAPVLKTVASPPKGIPENTIAEDFDLTLTVWKKGYRTGYEESAIAYTMIPYSLRDLYKQRIRWYSGGLQVIMKHIRSLGIKRHISLQIRRLILLDILLVEYFLPVMHISGYLLLAIILLAYLIGLNVLAISLPAFLLAYISAFISIIILGAINVVAAFTLTSGAKEALRSIPYAFIYVIFYIPFLAVAKVNSIIKVLKNVSLSWR